MRERCPLSTSFLRLAFFPWDLSTIDSSMHRSMYTYNNKGRVSTVPDENNSKGWLSMIMSVSFVWPALWLVICTLAIQHCNVYVCFVQVLTSMKASQLRIESYMYSTCHTFLVVRLFPNNSMFTFHMKVLIFRHVQRSFKSTLLRTAFNKSARSDPVNPLLIASACV